MLNTFFLCLLKCKEIANRLNNQQNRTVFYLSNPYQKLISPLAIFFFYFEFALENFITLRQTQRFWPANAQIIHRETCRKRAIAVSNYFELLCLIFSEKSVHHIITKTHMKLLNKVAHN